MPSLRARALRPSVIAMFTLGGLLASLAPVSAQGFRVGGRIAWVNPDTDVDVDSVRYFGGQVRLIAGRLASRSRWTAIRSRWSSSTRKFTETPIQASLLLRWAAAGRSVPVGRTGVVSAQGRTARRP